MDGVTAVTTLLLHTPEMLTVREVARLITCCKEWRERVAHELHKHFQAAKFMYQFFKALPHCPRLDPEQRVSHFSELSWAPFLAALGYKLSPLQFGLYYAFCYWMASKQWPLSCVTLLLYPCGMVKEIVVKLVSSDASEPEPPYIHFAKQWKSSTATLNLTHCNVHNDDVDMWIVGSAQSLESRVFEIAVAREFTDLNLSKLAYAMVPWQVCDKAAEVTYVVTGDEDEESKVIMRKTMSVCLPLARGNLLITKE